MCACGEELFVVTAILNQSKSLREAADDYFIDWGDLPQVTMPHLVASRNISYVLGYLQPPGFMGNVD